MIVAPVSGVELRVLETRKQPNGKTFFHCSLICSPQQLKLGKVELLISVGKKEEKRICPLVLLVQG